VGASDADRARDLLRFQRGAEKPSRVGVFGEPTEPGTNPEVPGINLGGRDWKKVDGGVVPLR